jgi:site-specific DNA-methyltransferase (cytosine-N4-specific)
VTPWLDDGDVRLYHGDVREVLAAMPDESVDCIVTSPPYWQLRDYGYGGQIGLEPTIEEYVEAIVGVFRELRRVLAPHGTCWLNLGDSFAGSWGNQGRKAERGTQRPINGGMLTPVHDGRFPSHGSNTGVIRDPGLKPKDLCLIPFRVALALQADGWWIRQRNVWAKPNPMPESVRDRTTSAAEEVFHLTKIGAGYYYDAEAVREAHEHPRRDRWDRRHLAVNGDDQTDARMGNHPAGRNLRNVWTIATEPAPEAHFATFPLALVERCLAAGCPKQVCQKCGEPSRRVVEQKAEGWHECPKDGARRALGLQSARSGLHSQYRSIERATRWTDCGHDAYRPGIVLDPFIGSGKTAQQARRMGLHAIGVDGSEEYLGIARRRLAADRARKWIEGEPVEVHEDQLAFDA